MLAKDNKKMKKNKKACVVAVDMGYGHQRTAFPLRNLSFTGEVINANNYAGIPSKDKNFWQQTKSFYETISRFRRVPIIGLVIFLFFDSFQKIMGYYPKRDLSQSNFNERIIYHFIKKGWGRDLVERLNKESLPLVTTFFTPAFMAEEFGYQKDIYCVICDADIARAWVPLNPKTSRIKYFAPCTWVRDRLKLYGVSPENIFLTGYPLPKENIGVHQEIIKKDLAYRILNLDPRGRYQKMYAPLIKNHLGVLPKLSNHPFTIIFSIGGAGAQKEIALQILDNLKEKIKGKQLRFIIAVGVREELRIYFQNRINELNLNGWATVLSGDSMTEYFKNFNEALRTTDILMTKPSELSFYAGLGIPIIIQPSIGSQEDFNRRWLTHIGSAFLQENPKYTDQWLWDLLETGDLAEAAMQGFIEIEHMGAYNIENIIAKNS